MFDPSVRRPRRPVAGRLIAGCGAQWFQVAFKLHAMVRVLTFGVESVYNVRVKKNELEC